MERFARWVLGYHGCKKDLATKLIGGELEVGDWPQSRQPYDWLGQGIYFWEHGPERAKAWARERHGDAEADVVGAIVHLGKCFDLLDVQFTGLLDSTYERERKQAETTGALLPSNTGRTPARGRRELDCYVINKFLQTTTGQDFQTVRGAFWEGAAAFPGSMIMRESHIQIAVRDPRCILGVFRPT